MYSKRSIMVMVRDDDDDDVWRAYEHLDRPNRKWYSPRMRCSHTYENEKESERARATEQMETNKQIKRMNLLSVPRCWVSFSVRVLIHRVYVWGK